MAAVASAVKKKAGRVGMKVRTKIAVIGHPEYESYSINKLMSPHQRKDLFDVMHALDEVKAKDGKVAVFTTSAPMALLYANYIGTRFLSEVVECAGHTGDVCTCVDDYLGVVDFVVIVESRDRASEAAGAMAARLARETDYPQKFGNAWLFIV